MSSEHPTEGNEALFEAENLTLVYGDTPAFEGVSLSIPAGEITALVGPSGCGKTSFLMSLNRLSDLVPNCRVTGSLRLGGQDILSSEVDLIALRRRVGMIFQKPNAFPFSIRKNLTFPLQEHGVRDRDKLATLVEASLRDVGLWDEIKDRLDAPALSLSGGQQQRLCLARALALKPEVLLLDEPCSALDPLSSGVVEDLIVSLRGRYTIVIVTHNLAQARRVADQVAVFWVQGGAGRLIESGSVGQVFEDPQDELTRSYVTGQRG
ncbi:MAG: phosphate ABC transporter ATP-binding protein [Planctomycetes bacterium]|nr:phosphate ABC transporter ATP-binding protein [Planctomycetota bacterium]